MSLVIDRRAILDREVRSVPPHKQRWKTDVQTREENEPDEEQEFRSAARCDHRRRCCGDLAGSEPRDQIQDAEAEARCRCQWNCDEPLGGLEGGYAGCGRAESTARPQNVTGGS